MADAPEQLIGDKAEESDPHDEELLRQCGPQLTGPDRRDRRRDRAAQNGRALRRCTRCWRVERLFAWMRTVRRLAAC